jgi:thiamine-phosphate pyrophosphorylase
MVPRLYLVTPVLVDPAEHADRVAAILEAADVAAVLLRLAQGEEDGLIRRVRSIAPVVQGANAALLVEDRPDIAVRAGADGAHLTTVAALRAALPGLKPERIAGAGGLKTRHDAMVAGEVGADYVMFGEPSNGWRPRFAAVLERVRWWAELFEVPCVGYAADLAEVEELVKAGVDFVALGDLAFDGGVAAVRAAAERLAAAEPAA